MTGIKIRDSERWKHRRKPAPVEDAAPADTPAPIETRAERGMNDRWVANQIVDWPLGDGRKHGLERGLLAKDRQRIGLPPLEVFQFREGSESVEFRRVEGDIAGAEFEALAIEDRLRVAEELRRRRPMNATAIDRDPVQAPETEEWRPETEEWRRAAEIARTTSVLAIL
jgi:hypothetical protein